uniref:Iron-sulfur cluster formation ABC transporter n=1 Tax=Rhodomonas salina TaxID=3034 RepID=A6MVW3_RHDSA|nr:sulfate ABC transporter protein [Rhodomonas salina]ABO70747.1 iron-sulfur cluster formation ABC transporter [Rhodomonas salina]
MISDSSKIILDIKDLVATVGTTQIINGLNLSVKEGEIHAIMGKNGSGKSTLAKIIAGHPAYTVNSGDILFEGESVLEIPAEERAQQGIFLGFQYPIEIPGVSNADFLRLSYNARRKFQKLPELEPLEFFEFINKKLEVVGMESSFLNRNVNEGFSGGEKKRNEILQMAVLDTKIAILDETDSGLDIDALKTVASGINKLATAANGIVLITHYQRLLDYISPDYVHVMRNGEIIKTGDSSLAKELELKGYDWID